MTARPTVKIVQATLRARAHSQRAPKRGNAPTVVPPSQTRAEDGQPKAKGKVKVEVMVADLTKDPRSDPDD